MDHHYMQFKTIRIYMVIHAGITAKNQTIIFQKVRELVF